MHPGFGHFAYWNRKHAVVIERVQEIYPIGAKCGNRGFNIGRLATVWKAIGLCVAGRSAAGGD